MAEGLEVLVAYLFHVRKLFLWYCLEKKEAVVWDTVVRWLVWQKPMKPMIYIGDLTWEKFQEVLIFFFFKKKKKIL